MKTTMPGNVRPSDVLVSVLWVLLGIALLVAAGFVAAWLVLDLWHPKSDKPKVVN